MSDALTQIRFLIIYPAMATFGLFLAGIFWLRWRRARCVGDFWAGALALALAVMALAGIAGLLMARSSGFSAVTSTTFTLGLLAPVLVLCAGTAVMLVRGWRR